jgi:hypothetical protein
LIEQVSQTKLTEITELGKMYVSRRAKWLLKKGYIRRIRGHENPALYRRTDKRFPPLEEGLKSCNASDQWDWSEAFEEEIFGGHYNVWSMKVNGPPLENWPWEWDKIGNQTPPHHFKNNITFDTVEGQIKVMTLRYIYGKKSKSITIWLDHDEFDSDEQMIRWLDWSKEILILIWRELQKMMEMPRKMKAGVAHAWKEMGLDEEDEYVDYSKGPNKPEWETTDRIKAINLKTVPTRVQSLEEDAARASLERHTLARQTREAMDKVCNGTSKARDAQDDFNRSQVDFNNAVADRLGEEPKETEKGDGAKAPLPPENIHDIMYH